jgi:uncharacterized protein YcbK (DUF882 family)
MDEEFMLIVVEIRIELAFPFPVHSAYRCAEYDRNEGGSGIHPTGKCIDIGVYGYRAWKLIQAAQKKEVTGIGLKQHGPAKGRFIHLDIVEPRCPGRGRGCGRTSKKWSHLKY